ncbi:hypothetical protein [uncultured Kordia sp.]|uniref:hypothetical protein n=1 Tax=uncultured Kordia sp. TaxID=507699 RepID=UPI0026295DEF|nr:hypothetical protein [uncultured Kordia sp.]
MIRTKEFDYAPQEHEAEAASNSYLISLVVIVVGLPLPIATLIATIIYYFANRKSSSYFVRWHCTQALLSQLTLFFINSIGFWWTISILYANVSVTTNYIVYIAILLLLNLTEFIATIYTAIETRKGIHVEWVIYGDLTNKVCKPQEHKHKYLK